MPGSVPSQVKAGSVRPGEMSRHQEIAHDHPLAAGVQPRQCSASRAPNTAAYRRFARHNSPAQRLAQTSGQADRCQLLLRANPAPFR